MEPRVLIVRQDRIGDAVLATPLPREIKRQWPGARVGVLVRGYTRALFEHNPHVDAIHTDDFAPDTRAASFWNRVGQLRRERYTHALMLLPDQRIAYMLAAAGIPRRYGHGITLFHALSLARPVMWKKFHPDAHQVDFALALARAIGVEVRDRATELHLTSGERALRDALRVRWSGSGARRVVGLHITHQGSAPNWEPAAWAELAGRLAADASVQVVVTDPEPPDAVADLPGVLAVNRRGDLRMAMVRLAALDLLVSSSTGPMHMAAALGVATLSLFCPLPACAPSVWGPVGNDARHVLPEEGYCATRCPGHPHRCTFAGSAHVAPAAVARQILPGASG